MKRIPIAGPWITDLEVRYAAEAAATDWYENAGTFVRRFERAFADYIGVRHAVSLPHATAGIHLALAALKIGPGDEVIVPEITWIASAAPVTYVGATPVFADVDARTWCMDVDSMEACITPRTKAIIPVDVYGGVPDYDALLAVARRHGLAVIEDAAEAHGSEYHGRKTGSFGEAAVFSFHGTKTMATGEGGMLVTDRQDIYDRVMVLRDHGRPPGDRFFQFGEVAFKYKMSGVQAALGLAQLERIEELVGKKRQIFDWYKEGLGGHPNIQLNFEPPNTRNSYWMSTAILDASLGLTTRDIMATFDANGIDSRPFFAPLSSVPAYRDFPQAELGRSRNRICRKLAVAAINLPSALMLTQDQVALTSRLLRELADGKPIGRAT
jgi:perosamine synthetase